jgi:predicted nucleotidyltransferase
MSILPSMVEFDRTALARLCRDHDVAQLLIFGSAARGEEHPDSDLDLIVAFRRPTGLLELVRFERQLGEFFGRSVDLVTEPGLSPYIRDAVLASTAVLYDAAA